MDVRPFLPADWRDVARIYAEGLAGGVATFETAVPSWEAWDAAHLPAPRLVADRDGDVVGWVAVSAASRRPAYRGVVEHSVYVDPTQHGRGVGSALLRALIASTEAAGIWTIQSGIFPNNTPSLRAHEKAGFRVIGTREQVGHHPFDGWRDVLMVERCSRTAGRGQPDLTHA